ncbi:MAG: N-formylglutamate amidohydrolase [Bacteroidia bacterium]
MIYDIIEPKDKKVPILVSIPHAGTLFPEELQDQYVPGRMAFPDDTDWFLPELYSFVSEMGITLITARYSRWVIDLNRDPDSKPLYNDGRAITGLTPDKTFFGEPLYLANSPDADEISRRKNLYYFPYHHQIAEILSGLREKYNHVLLYDAHSIRRRVPSIYSDPFPDVILGDNDGTSAHPDLIAAAWEVLASGTWSPMHNTLFRGGHITRHFGNPAKGIHALQLERSKDLYMDDTETHYHPGRAAMMQARLRNMFEKLILTLEKLNHESH